MPERLLHYIWQYKFFSRFEQYTTQGEKIEVIDVGKLNTDSGPDFFNAKLKINGQLWAGNIEIHINSSDWYKHHHDQNPNYDNIIMHIVAHADTEIRSTKGRLIPQCELKYPEGIQHKYIQWLISGEKTACQDDIANVPTIYINDWKSSLLADRLQQKSNYINDLLKHYNNDWEETFYVTLAHYFGFHTNGAPFELLAKQTPLAYIGKHRNDLFQIEAILYGQAGLLTQQPSDSTDRYYNSLCKEYQFLKTKFSLTPIQGELWKFLRMRPDNFPTVRIAEFAALLHQTDHLFASLTEAKTINELRKLFEIKTSEYWDTHYMFNKESIKSPKRLGANAIDILIINVVTPFLFAYGTNRNQSDYQDRAEQMLDELPPEKNSIITNWKQIGLSCQSAADTQALIHLHEQYCTNHKCLHCRIAHKIFSKTINGVP